MRSWVLIAAAAAVAVPGVALELGAYGDPWQEQRYWGD